MSDPHPSSVEAHQPFAVGEVLNDTYLVRSVIGDGAMGQVLEAQDLKLLRRVAIKVAWTSAIPVTIRHEAQALAAIRHAGLPAVYALAQHGNHEYMVMERIHGTALDEVLLRAKESRQPIAIRRVVDLLCAVAEALAAVHGAGLIHRDIKPANVMLASPDRVVLVDFGLFVPQFEAGTQEKVRGTPWYMAPELIRNKVDTGCWRLVDLYALGAMAFEMLVGEPPFPSLDVREVLRGHVRGEVPDIAERRDDVPPSLAAMVRELLAKSPHERPQAADDVVATLRAILARLDPDTHRQQLSVLVVSPDRGPARALVDSLRRLLHGVDVRTISDARALLDPRASRVPDVVLADARARDPHPYELCMFLRGSSEPCVLGVFGNPEGAEAAPLAELLGISILPPLSAADPSVVARIVRAARRKLTR